MSDLAAFIRARLSEDEGGARFMMDREASEGLPRTEWLGSPFGERVLREVEAMRAIVDLHQISTTYVESRDDDYRPVKIPEVQCHVCGWASDREGSACETLRALAGIWRDHPDHDPAWE